MSTTLILAAQYVCPASPSSPTYNLDSILCVGKSPGVYGEPDAVPYDAPGTGGGGGEAWSFLGMGANAWFVIIAGLIIWALIASARARHRAELARHEGLRTRYQDQAPPESNLGGGGDYYDAGYDEPRSMYGDRGRAPGPGDDWEEL